MEEVLRDDKNSKRLAKVIYRLQDKKAPKMVSLKERANQIDLNIENIMDAIKTGIVTKATKAELEKLEDEVEVRINEEAIQKGGLFEIQILDKASMVFIPGSYWLRHSNLMRALFQKVFVFL